MRRILIWIGSLVLLLGVTVVVPAAPIPEFKLDHFHVYKVDEGPSLDAVVSLKGQFDEKDVPARIKGPVFFANPVEKNRGKIIDENAHLNWYKLTQEVEEPKRTVLVRNQFNDGEPQRLILGQPEFLLVPTKKVHDDKVFPIAEGLDHFKVYRVLEATPVNETVTLRDQFGAGRNIAERPVFFCVPVSKTHNDKTFRISNPRDHLTVYSMKPARKEIKFEVSDQIGQNTLKTTQSQWLCLPSLKEFPGDDDDPPPFQLDHFSVYKVGAEPGASAQVGLRGQFDQGLIPAEVRGPTHFANPVSKNGGRIIDKNAHLNWYEIRGPEEKKREVVVRNQFRDRKEQNLVLGQPRFLLVPTKKVHGDNTFPIAKGLDHYKCYEVLEAEPVNEPVRLIDQFGRNENRAVRPVFFCVPVFKQHDREKFPINNERDHLTVYNLKPVDKEIGIDVSDQIGKNRLSVTSLVWLCLPSEKLKPSD